MPIGNLIPLEPFKPTEPKHIEPEQMLDYLAGYIKYLMGLSSRTDEIAPLLEIYFKYSNEYKSEASQNENHEAG